MIGLSDMQATAVFIAGFAVWLIVAWNPWRKE